MRKPLRLPKKLKLARTQKNRAKAGKSSFGLTKTRKLPPTFLQKVAQNQGMAGLLKRRVKN